MVGESRSPTSAGRAQTLAAAAQLALETARRERLALLHIAERKGAEHVQYWFANNILSIVSIEGISPGAAAGGPITKDMLGGLLLDADMNGLSAPGEERPRYVDLRVPAAELSKYLNWMRTVQ
jgi:hypothetical protein